MKKIIRGLLLTFLALVLVACGNGGGAEDSSGESDSANDTTEETTETEETTDSSGEEVADDSVDSDSLAPITVAQPVFAVLWAPYYIADGLGFYEEEGLDIEFVSIQGDVPTAPVLSGDADFGLFGPEMIYSMNERGQGTKLLSTATQKMPYALISSPEYTTVESLEGTTISAADSGSSGRQFVRTALSLAGLDPDSDATYVNVPNSSLSAALESGEIAAAHSSPEVRQNLLDQGNNLLVDMYDGATHEEILGSPTYEMYITFTTDEYIEENPEVVQSYINGVYKAILWMQDKSAEEISEVLAPYFSGMENLEQAIAEIIENDLYSSDGSFSESGHEAISVIAEQAGILENEIAQEEVVDSTFIEEAQSNIEIDAVE